MSNAALERQPMLLNLGGTLIGRPLQAIRRRVLIRLRSGFEQFIRVNFFPYECAPLPQSHEFG